LPLLPPVTSFHSNDNVPVAPPLTTEFDGGTVLASGAGVGASAASMAHLSSMPDASRALRTFPGQGTVGSQAPTPAFATQTVITAPSEAMRSTWVMSSTQPQTLAVLPQASADLAPGLPTVNPGCSPPCWAGALGGCYLGHFLGGIVGGVLGYYAQKAINYEDPDSNCIQLPRGDGVIVPLAADGGSQGTAKVRLWQAGFTAPLTEQGFQLVKSDRRQSEMDAFLTRLVQYGGPPFRSLQEAATVLMLKPKGQGVRPIPGRWRFEGVRQQQLIGGNGFFNDTIEIRLG